ncbi:YkvA family protein, partial [Pseudomonas aeruginosa]|nr:YkvA family protein [Pseudomonas aeruginosa]
PALLIAVARKRSRLKLVKSDLRLLQELLVAWVRGEYRGLSRQALLSVIAALAYFLSPVDIVPDFIFGVGLLDDLAVLAWVVRRWQAELDAFKVWRDAQGVETQQALRELPAPRAERVQGS